MPRLTGDALPLNETNDWSSTDLKASELKVPEILQSVGGNPGNSINNFASMLGGLADNKVQRKGGLV